MDRAYLYSFLSRCRYGVLASAGDDGAPQSALVGIAVTPALEIIFDTLRSSRKHPNLLRRPTCSLVVGWESEQTVQYEGIAFEPGIGERDRYLAAYFAVWPGGKQRLRGTAIAHFVVRPKWIRYSDYQQQPPLIKEFSLE